MHSSMWLGLQTVSSLERCPLFSVLYREVPLCFTHELPFTSSAAPPVDRHSTVSTRGLCFESYTVSFCSRLTVEWETLHVSE